MRKLFKKKFWIITALGVSILFVGAAALFLNKQINREESEKIIPIAMAADNNYTYPTMVSITSLMTNAKNSTHYDVHIMISGDFLEENKQKLLSLQEKFDNKCKIDLIDMQDRYKNANVAGHIRTSLTTPAYYRLSLASLLPNVDKIIWLDGDTLIFEDLTDLINIDMDGFYYKGFLDYPYPMDVFNFKGDHYICSGVMLINLKKLRQDEMEPKIEAFIKENNEKLVQHDQTVINVLFQDNIGALPVKYGIFNFKDLSVVNDYSNRLIAKNRYTNEEVLAAYENPAILHYVYKPWGKDDVNRKGLWWEYAAKTDCFEEIKAYYEIS